MGKIYNNILELIGNTPIVKLNGLNDSECEVLLKLESFNAGRSVKDRVGYAMILDAEEKGLINKDSFIIEPTSGNTGIGLAIACAVKGYKLIIVMPDSMSKERISLLKAYGAVVELTPDIDGMSGSIAKAIELSEKYENSFIPQQFKNAANPKAHESTTAKEIISDCDGKLDILVAGIGTGGTITGLGKALKSFDKNIKIIGFEPENSAVISGEIPGGHMIQGIGAGFIPDVLNLDYVDEIVKAKDKDALDMMRKLGREEGVLVGISSGAALSVALEIAKRPENKGKRLLVLMPDSGERYLSMGIFQ